MSISSKNCIAEQDLDVCHRVQNSLSSRNFPAIRQLEVDVRQGSVTLTGQVSSFYEKQIAITSCHGVAGVMSLVDHIEVADHLILGQV